MLILFTTNAAAALPKWREVAANGTWPQPRFSHSSVILQDQESEDDSERMVIFGGNNFDAVNELFSYDVGRREWTQLKPAGDKPSKRYGHQAVATSDGRMVIFGGYNGSFLNDVYELSANTTAPKWRRVRTTGEPPIARDGHSAVIAPDGHTMLVFGGFDGKKQLDDVHALDTQTFTWTQLSAAAPTPENGGSDGDGDGESEARPAPRYLHAAARCEDGFFVFGGYLAGGAFADDLWRLSLVRENDDEGAPPTAFRWKRLKGTGARPPASMGHAAAADVDGNLWLSGGFGDGSFTNTLHVYSPKRNRWSKVEAKGARPSPRHKHSLVATSDGELLIFGGNDFGPTRGFYSLDSTAYAPGASASSKASSASSASGGSLAPFGSTAPQLAQLGALLLIALLAHLHEMGAIGAAQARALLSACLAALLAAEACMPPPGGLVLRVLGLPRRGGPTSGFTRTATSMATDVAAAIAAASLASLVSSGSIFIGK